MSPLLLLSVLLLGGWPADGAQNASESEVYIVAKEGDSMLIECNVTGGHDGVQWFNPKGPLTGEEGVLMVFDGKIHVFHLVIFSCFLLQIFQKQVLLVFKTGAKANSSLSALS